MRAFLYSAGRGDRLGPELGKNNKILLQFGGRTLLEWHVIRLIAIGVTELFVITGYDRENVVREINTLAGKYAVTFTEIFNERFRYGSALSFSVSMNEVCSYQGPEPQLLMDGDVLYPPGMLDLLIQSVESANLLVDQDFSLDDDDPVLVPMNLDKEPFDFVKGWKGESCFLGESVGFFAIHPGCLPRLAEITAEHAKDEQTVASYDDILRIMVKEGIFKALDVTGMPWTEVDFPKDILFAEREILPAIEKLEAFGDPGAASAM